MIILITSIKQRKLYKKLAFKNSILNLLKNRKKIAAGKEKNSNEISYMEK